MANLPNPSSPTFKDVYQLERTDLWDAGTGGNGVANRQAKDLLERDAFIKSQVDTLNAAVELVAEEVSGTQTLNSSHKNKLVLVNAQAGSGDVIITLPNASTFNGGILTIRNNPKFAAGSDLVFVQGGAAVGGGTDVIFFDEYNDTQVTLEPSTIIRVKATSTGWQVLYHNNPVANSLVGAVQAFAANTPPIGWLKCNGQAVNRAKYSRLFARIGTTFGAGNGTNTFNLPDLRGEFIRGWADDRSVDTGRVFGSAQKGTILPIDSTGVNQPYAPTFTSVSIAANSPVVAERTGLDYDANGATNYPNTQSSYANADGTGGFDYGVVRPRNVAMLYCIKY